MPRLSTCLAFCAPLVAAFAAAPARAQDDCNGLTPVLALDMYFDAGGRSMAKAFLQDREKYLVLDTGGFWSVLEAATARELDLRMQTVPISVIGVLGHRSQTAVSVENFHVGGMPPGPHMFMVDPNGAGTISDLRPVGTLGQNFFLDYDADFDFATGTLTLFRQEHCAGAATDRHPNAIAVIPFELDDTHHIRFPVLLDGERLNAMLDTGTSGSVLNLTVAKDVFGIDADAPDVVRTGELEGVRTLPTYRYRFGLLEINGIAVEDPDIELLPDLMASGFDAISGQTAEPGFEIILGMSVLSRFRIYIAYGEQTLYISSASPTPE